MTTQIHPDAARWGGWHWTSPRHGEHFRRCSYCGSIHPEDLAAEPVWKPQWADMKYGWPHKFYVPIPNRNPGALYVISASHDSHGGTYLPLETLTDEQRGIVERDGWLGRDYPWEYFQFGTRPDHFGKFYTIHLADPEIPDEVCADIEQRSGLEFTFEIDNGEVGHVLWRDASGHTPPQD